MSNEIQSISQSNYVLHNIDAKKLYVQEPLFTANSGDAVYVGWRPDETVLFEGSAASGVVFPLSEPISAFNEIKFTIESNDRNCFAQHSFNPQLLSANNWSGTIASPCLYSRYLKIYRTNFSANSGVIQISYEKDLNSTAQTYGIQGWIREVIGVNRKENA